MFTVLEQSCHSEDNKLIVSLTLKIPIQFELDLFGTQTTEENYYNIPENIPEAINHDSNSNSIEPEDKVAQIYEQIQVVSNQLVTQILNSQNQTLFDLNQSQSRSDFLNHSQELELVSLQANSYLNTSFNCEEQAEDNQYNKTKISFQKSRKFHLADSLNDALTLTINTFGNILFLGKLANYSWE